MLVGVLHFRMPRLAIGQLWVAMLERLELMQHLIAVERADVACLDRRQAAYRPAEVHEMRLDGVRQRVHADLFRQATALPRVARAACRDDVGPVVRTAALPACEQVLSSVKTDREWLTGLFVVGPNGRGICGASPVVRTLDVSDREYFRNAVEYGQFKVSDVITSRVTGEAIVAETTRSMPCAAA